MLPFLHIFTYKSQLVSLIIVCMSSILFYSWFGCIQEKKSVRAQSTYISLVSLSHLLTDDYFSERPKCDARDRELVGQVKRPRVVVWWSPKTYTKHHIRTLTHTINKSHTLSHRNLLGRVTQPRKSKNNQTLSWILWKTRDYIAFFYIFIFISNSSYCADYFVAIHREHKLVGVAKNTHSRNVCGDIYNMYTRFECATTAHGATTIDQR